MFRSGWIAAVAFGLVLTGAVGIFLWSLTEFKQYYYSHYEVIDWNNDAGDQRKKFVFCADEQNHSQVQENCISNLEYKNFLLQQNVEEFTYWTAVVGIYSSLISVIGLVCLFISLQQTRTSLADTKSFGEAQTRAYVFFKDISVFHEQEKNRRKITVQIHNTGNSPAYDVSFGIGFAVIAEGLLESKTVELQSIPDIGPGMIYDFTHYIRDESWAAWIISSTGLNESFFVFGKVVYTNIFRKNCWTTFRRYIPKNSNGKMDVEDGFVFCEEGNDSEMSYDKKAKH